MNPQSIALGNIASKGLNPEDDEMNPLATGGGAFSTEPMQDSSGDMGMAKSFGRNFGSQLGQFGDEEKPDQNKYMGTIYNPVRRR